MQKPSHEQPSSLAFLAPSTTVPARTPTYTYLSQNELHTYVNMDPDAQGNERSIFGEALGTNGGGGLEAAMGPSKQGEKNQCSRAIHA